MKKIILLLILVAAALIISISYFRSLEVGSILELNTEEALPNEINSFIWFSSMSEKELMVNGKDSIKEIVSLLENLKVRKRITSPFPAYNPKLKETYGLDVYKSNGEISSIRILNSKDIVIDHKNYYRIVGNPDLSKLYEIIILDQPEGTLDELYYDLLDYNK